MHRQFLQKSDAEGFAREFGKGLIAPHSAGLIAAGVNPRAIAVMKRQESIMFETEIRRNK